MSVISLLQVRKMKLKIWFTQKMHPRHNQTAIQMLSQAPWSSVGESVFVAHEFEVRALSWKNSEVKWWVKSGFI